MKFPAAYQWATDQLSGAGEDDGGDRSPDCLPCPQQEFLRRANESHFFLANDDLVAIRILEGDPSEAERVEQELREENSIEILENLITPGFSDRLSEVGDTLRRFAKPDQYPSVRKLGSAISDVMALSRPGFNRCGAAERPVLEAFCIVAAARPTEKRERRSDVLANLLDSNSLNADLLRRIEKRFPDIVRLDKSLHDLLRLRFDKVPALGKRRQLKISRNPQNTSLFVRRHLNNAGLEDHPPASFLGTISGVIWIPFAVIVVIILANAVNKHPLAPKESPRFRVEEGKSITPRRVVPFDPAAPRKAPTPEELESFLPEKTKERLEIIRRVREGLKKDDQAPSPQKNQPNGSPSTPNGKEPPGAPDLSNPNLR